MDASVQAPHGHVPANHEDVHEAHAREHACAKGERVPTASTGPAT